jgi:hypothetical protein
MTERPNNLSAPDIVSGFPGNRRILFGHQSVGLNILDGIQVLCPATSVVEIVGDGPVSGGHGIFHSRIGANHKPYSKIDDFARLVKANDTFCDVAMMKLCYVDIGKDTDIHDLFRYYRSMVEELANSAPGVHLLHMTVPLRSIRLGLRSRLKLLAGQTLEPVEDNVQREAYNTLMRKEYQGEATLFDLAEFEATRPDGSTSSIKIGGKMIRTLYPGYSDDGGHLNNNGRQLIAQKLVDLIAEL